MNYLAFIFIFRIVHVCVEKQSAVKAHDVNGACTHCGLLKEYPMLPTPKKIVSYFKLITVHFCLLYFLKFNFIYLPHY